MMPGETPPAAPPAGLAAEAATACANCGSLQQNLNEYVAALIVLKQKIMDTDRLLTDYEQKCNELKCAERENNAFRQQVENMLQRLSPLEKCKEELGSVKAELEEKKSSLKMYQETHLEYVHVKEEMDKSDATKKKLEARVKKLEKATEKHQQDFKKLKAEKKVLEKELKKAQQEKIESFPSGNKKKVVKHVETQSEREWSITDLDKEKIKLLLEELWLCIDSSTEKRQINENDYSLPDCHNNSRLCGKRKAVQNPPKCKRVRGEMPSHSSPETCATQASLTPLQIKLHSSRAARYVNQMENKAMEASEACTDDGNAFQGQSPECTLQTEPSARSLDLLNKEPEEAGEDLTEILNWIRPLPRLLSPIQFSPVPIPGMLFGELSESSDEEMDQDAQKIENILENHSQSTSEAYTVSRKDPAEPPSKYYSSGANNENSNPNGSPTVLKHNKSSKDGEKYLEKTSEIMERNPEIAFHNIENVAKSSADVTETENKTLVCDLISINYLQEQEKTVEPRHVQEMILSDSEQVLNEASDLIKEEKEGLIGTVETSVSSPIEDNQPSSDKGCSSQETEEPILATENMLVVPNKDVSSNVISSEDIQAESDLGRSGPLTEHTAPEENRTEELWPKDELEFKDRGMNPVYSKFHSELDHHHIDQVQNEHIEIALIQTTEEDACASGASIKLPCLEGNYSSKDGCCKDSECDINEKTELDSLDSLRPKLNIKQAIHGREKSLCCSIEVVQTRNECSTTPSASKNEEGDKLKIEAENTVSKDKIAGNILGETPSLVITKGGLHLEDHAEKKDSRKLLQEEPGNTNVSVLPSQVSVVKNCLSGPKEHVQTTQAAPELESFTRNASELEPFEDSDNNEYIPIIHNISNSIPSVGVIIEDKCLRLERRVEYGEPLKISTVETTAVKCEKGTSSGIVLEAPVQSCLATGNSPNDAPYQEMTKQNDESISPKTRKSSMEDTELNECCVTNEAILEVNPNRNSAQSVQDASKAENSGPKAVSPVVLAIISEPSTALFFGGNCPFCDVAANEQFPDASFIAISARADHTELCHDREHLLDKEVVAEHSEASQQKSLDCCSHRDQGEVEIKRAGKQSTSSETQTLVDVKGYCDVQNSGEFFEAPSPNSTSAVPTSAATQDVKSDDKGLIATSGENIVSPSENCRTVEHPHNETVSEEMIKISSNEVSSKEEDEAKSAGDAIVALDVSASSSSEEEYPLRKVNLLKKHSRLLAFKEELDIVQNSQADAPCNMIGSSNIHKMSHFVEDASPEHEQAHNGDFCAEEATAETVEHSYAAPLSNGKDPSVLEASVTDEKEAGKSVALTNRAEVDNTEPASGKLSANDLEVDGGRLSPKPEPSGTSAEPSAASSVLSVKQEKTSAALDWGSKMAQNHLTSHHFDGSPDTSVKKEHHITNDEDIPASITNENSIPLDSKNPSPEKQEVVSQKPELFIKSSKQNKAEHVPKPSAFINNSAKAGLCGRLHPKIPSRRGRRKSRQDALAETVIANAETPTSMKSSPKTLKKIREEMGTPLPPLLPPLLATPPRTVHPVSPVMSSSSQCSVPSPLNKLISPLYRTPVPPLISPLSDEPKHKRPALHTTPSPSEVLTGERTLSSPLQFCAATPKHALPVPGRFPPSAAGSAIQAVPQENSVKILDSMYPKLSARAITLNILKGNIQLSRPSSLEGNSVPLPLHQISGFKEIASSSTAFVKTGSTSFSEPPPSNMGETEKRKLASLAMPKSAKKLRLDNEMLNSDLGKEELSVRDFDTGAQNLPDETACLYSGDAILSVGDSKLLLPVQDIDPDNRAVTVALEKMSESCFDLFPVIHSRVHVGSMLSIPTMTDEEKEIVYEFGIAKKYLAEPALHAVLKKLKHQKTSLSPYQIHSLCRVYVGICRQLGDLEKARLFCYSLLKEDFPQSGKLILFIGNMWSEIFTSKGVISKAIELVARKRSNGHVLKCLKTILKPEESGPVDMAAVISSLLLTIKQCPQMEFQESEQHGEDLKESMWEYVFAIDLLCSHQKWVWTHDHIISKELWPIMDKWTKNRTSSGNASSPSDMIIATVLRLIGRLSQIGLKEGFLSAVKNISSVLGAFLRHAKEKDVPWAVQLAAVYALCEMGPSSPSEILDAIRAWETVSGKSLPPAVSSSITEVSGLLEQ